MVKALCTCDGEAIVANQTEVSKILLQNEENRQNLLFKLKVNKSRAIEILHNSCWVDLSKLEKISEDIDDKQSYIFFLRLTELMADLCLNKNFAAIDPLKAIYT